MNIHCPITPSPCIGSRASPGAPFHRWQKDAEMAIFFFFLCLRAFVCDITPHANLQIIESQGNNSRRLFCPLTTPVVAADAVILPKIHFGWDTNEAERENTVWKTPSRLQSLNQWSVWKLWEILAKTNVIVQQVQSVFECEFKFHRFNFLREQVMMDILKPCLLLIACKFWWFIRMTKLCKVAKMRRRNSRFCLSVIYKVRAFLESNKSKGFLIYLLQKFFIFQDKP